MGGFTLCDFHSLVLRIRNYPLIINLYRSVFSNFQRRDEIIFEYVIRGGYLLISPC